MLAWIALAVAVISLLTAVLALAIAGYRTGAKANTAQFAAIEAQITDLTSAIDGVRLAMTKIRARLNAQRRRKANGADDEPEFDLSTESGRTAARQQLEAQLAQSGGLHSRAHRR